LKESARYQDQQEAENLGLLDGKGAIITGSARGIGRATAELFCREGAKVLINDLDGDVAEQAAKEIDGETAVFSGDLTKPGTPEGMVKAAIDAFGPVDAVVNNAGYTWDGVVHKMTDEQFQAMLDIHTIVPFRVIRHRASWREAAKKEAEAGEEVFRKIVNVTSISGTMGNSGQANYSSAKAGVTGLTKTIAKSGAPSRSTATRSRSGSWRLASPRRGRRARRWRPPVTAARRSRSGSPSSSARWRA
jgi:3-oxoacyl-[acyl-carrier protein] reductase